jgi:hypothetical protein
MSLELIFGVIVAGFALLAYFVNRILEVMIQIKAELASFRSLEPKIMEIDLMLHNLRNRFSEFRSKDLLSLKDSSTGIQFDMKCIKENQQKIASRVADFALSVENLRDALRSRKIG